MASPLAAATLSVQGLPTEISDHHARPSLEQPCSGRRFVRIAAGNSRNSPALATAASRVTESKVRHNYSAELDRAGQGGSHVGERWNGRNSSPVE